jgi:predicted ATPase
VRFLSFLARRTDDGSVLLALSARDDAPVEAALWSRLLRELDREERLSRFVLAPLGRADIERLVARTACAGHDAASLARLTERVWAVSEGNPSIAIHMTHVADTTPGVIPDIPAHEREAIARRLACLSETARKLTPLAAVIGREFDFARLVHAAGLPAAKVAAGVEELVRHRILHDVDGGFRFVYERVRHASLDGV